MLTDGPPTRIVGLEPNEWCRRTDTDADYTAGAIGEVLLDRGVIPARVCAVVEISAV